MAVQSIQRKSFLFILSAVMVITILAVMLVYAKSSSIIKDDAINFTEINLGILRNELGNKYDRLSNVMTRISLSNEIRKLTEESYGQVTYEEFRQKDSVTSMLETFIADEAAVNRLYLFLPDGKRFYTGSPLEKYSDLEMLSRICQDSYGKTSFVNDGSLYYFRPFHYSGTSESAYACIRVDTDDLGETIRSFQIPGAELFALYGEDELIVGDGTAFESIPGIYQGLAVTPAGKTFIVSSEVEPMNLRLIAAIPYSVLIVDSIKILQIAIIVILLSLVIAFFISSVLSKVLFRDLRSLRISMLSISQGHLDERASVPETTEIRDLALVFNSMMDRITLLINEAAQKEIEKQKMRQDYLNAQIKPHFIYNTLNKIRTLAIKRGEEDIAEAVSATVELLRAAIGKRSEFVSISDELGYAGEYVKLNNFRNNQHITLFVDTDGYVTDRMIPTLSLQPIVENCCVHAYSGCVEGAIHINAGYSDGFVTIVIADNGCGMGSGKKSAPGELYGIGLGNVFERMRLIYGDSFTYNVESKEGMGTSITLRYRDV
ncbi:MAG: sensor histidine kinase [Bullifex sp.]